MVYQQVLISPNILVGPEVESYYMALGVCCGMAFFRLDWREDLGGANVRMARIIFLERDCIDEDYRRREMRRLQNLNRERSNDPSADM